jgi:hypothetical protein
MELHPMPETFEALAALARFLEQTTLAVAAVRPAEAMSRLLLASLMRPEVRT